MDSIVFSNLKQRPTRTAVSILGVALGVILVMVNSGLVVGMQKDRGKRESNTGADIVFTREFSLTTSSLTLPSQYGPRLERIPGVAFTTPIARYIKDSKSGIGFEILEGIDYPSYARMSGITIVQGRPLTEEMDVIVDERYAQNKKVGVGSEVELFNRTFRIAGIYAPESGGRIKVGLAAMQNVLRSPERCSQILVKCAPGETPDTVVARINAELPGNQVLSMGDLQVVYDRGIPAFNTFLKIVVGLSVIVSLLVILLAMYTTIAERTREIGILKSLGASRGFIIKTIEQEALMLCLAGIILGYAGAFAIQAGLTRFTSLVVSIEPRWMLYTAVIGIISGLLGALYPALRAAAKDPVQALSYE